MQLLCERCLGRRAVRRLYLGVWLLVLQVLRERCPGRLAVLRPPPSLEPGLCWFFVNVVSGRSAVLRTPFLGACFVQVLCECCLSRLAGSL